MVAAAVAGVMAVNAAVVEVRAVESDSMEPTLAAGERVAVAKAGVDAWDLAHGTLVVFDAVDLWTDAGDPQGSVFVKRIVGVGGDRITCCTRQGQLLRNGLPLEEPYLGGVSSDQQRFDVIVAPGHYWVLGDNRAESADSRAHFGGPGGGNIPASRIIGTAEAVVWPPGAVRRLEAPDE